MHKAIQATFQQAVIRGQITLPGAIALLKAQGIQRPHAKGLGPGPGDRIPDCGCVVGGAMDFPAQFTGKGHPHQGASLACDRAFHADRQPRRGQIVPFAQRCQNVPSFRASHQQTFCFPGVIADRDPLGCLPRQQLAIVPLGRRCGGSNQPRRPHGPCRTSRSRSARDCRRNRSGRSRPSFGIREAVRPSTNSLAPGPSTFSREKPEIARTPQ